MPADSHFSSPQAPMKRIHRQKKVEQDRVADDWDAESSDEEPSQPPAQSVGPSQVTAVDSQDDDFPPLGSTSTKTAVPLPFGALKISNASKGNGNTEPVLNRPGGPENASEMRSVAVDDRSRSVWEKANVQPAEKQGVIFLRSSDAAGRSLPPALFAGANGASSPGITEGGTPQILRRASPSVGGANAQGKATGSLGSAAMAGMTREQREKAYAEARARIFGSTSSATEPSSPDAGVADGAAQKTKRAGRPNRGTGGRSSRDSSQANSQRTSPAPSANVSRASSTNGSATHDRSRPADGMRQPRGPTEGSAGFAPR